MNSDSPEISSKLPPRRPNQDLTGKQKRHLRGLAHHLEALIRVGQQGLVEGLAQAVSEALEAHELIKVKILEAAPVTKEETVVYLTERCGAHQVGRVGRTVILYRRHAQKPKITI